LVQIIHVVVLIILGVLIILVAGWVDERFQNVVNVVAACVSISVSISVVSVAAVSSTSGVE